MCFPLMFGCLLAQPEEVAKGFDLRSISVAWTGGWPGNHADDVFAFSADGSLVAAAEGEVVRVWSATDGTERVRVHLPIASPWTHLAFPPDGKTLVAVGSADNAVRWFDLSTGKQTRERSLLPAKAGLGFDHPSVLRMAPSGDWLFGYAAVGDTAKAVVCDTATGSRRSVIQDHPRFSFQTVLPAGDRPLVIAAAYANDAVARVWDLTTGRVVRSLGGSTIGRAWYNRVLLAVSPDGGMVAGNMGHPPGRHNRTSDPTEIWRVDDGRLVATLPEQASSLAFAADNRIAVVVVQGKVRVYDLLKEAYDPDYLIPGPMQHQVVSRDGRTLAIAAWHDGSRPGGAVMLGRLPTLPDPLPAVGDLAGDRLADALAMISSANEFRGRRAVRAFADRPDQALAVLGGRLSAEPERRRATVIDLVKTLDDDSPDTRDKALTELLPLAHRFEPRLAIAHKDAPLGEMRNRLSTALNHVRDDPPPADLLTDLRAVEVLEAINTAAAKALLAKLAAGAADSRLTEAAKAALDRLKKPVGKKLPER